MPAPDLCKNKVIGNTTKIQIKRIALIFSRNEIYCFHVETSPCGVSKTLPKQLTAHSPLLTANP